MFNLDLESYKSTKYFNIPQRIRFNATVGFSAYTQHSVMGRDLTLKISNTNKILIFNTPLVL